MENKGKNVRDALSEQSPFDYQNVRLPQPQIHNTKNEIQMGDNINVGPVGNNSGPVIIGKEIRIGDSFNDRKETAGKIAKLIALIRQEQNISDGQKQSLVSNFDKVKEEMEEATPDKSKIFKWLSAAKGILENLVLSHHVSEAV